MPGKLIQFPATGIYVLAGAIIFAGCWYGPGGRAQHHAVVVLFVGTEIGFVLWLWNMYPYIANAYPTRMRSLGTGWIDGGGHLGAWGGVLISGAFFSAADPKGWILLITLPGALLPALLIAIFGKRQRRRALEELAR